MSQVSAITKAQILELREAYREALTQIEGFSSAIEREVGLASHRREATDTYKRLMATGKGLDDQTLGPLNVYVSSLSGGESAEKAVTWLELKAQEGVKHATNVVVSKLIGAPLLGGAAVAAGVFTQVAVTAEALGGFIFTLIVGGGSGFYMIVRSFSAIGQSGADQMWDKGWARASSVGTVTDHAMQQPRLLELALWRATGAGALPQPFTARARGVAKFMLGVAWALAALGAILIVLGFARAASDWWNQNNPNRVPTFTFTTP
jgi:hypothetical protein